MSTNADRAAQLEQVADEFTRRRYGSNPDLSGDLVEAVAEFALKLAEETREEIAKWHDGEMSGCIALAESAERNGDHDDARIHRLSAAEHRHSAAAIRATPIPIGDTATQEADHD